MFVKVLTSFYLPNRGHAELMLCIDLIVSSAKNVVVTIKKNFGHIVRLSIPSREKSDMMRDVLRTEFLAQWKPTMLPRGMRVSLIDAVRPLPNINTIYSSIQGHLSKGQVRGYRLNKVSV